MRSGELLLEPQRTGELARSTGTAFVCATHDPLLVGLANDVLSLGSA